MKFLRGILYDVMRKVSAEEIKDNIIRYGLPEDATDDVKEVAKQMEKEEVVAQVLKTEDIHPPKTGISVHFSGSLV